MQVPNFTGHFCRLAKKKLENGFKALESSITDSSLDLLTPIYQVIAAPFTFGCERIAAIGTEIHTYILYVMNGGTVIVFCTVRLPIDGQTIDPLR